MVQWHCISQDHHRRKIFNNGSGSQTVDITSNIKENADFIFPVIQEVNVMSELMSIIIK